MAKTKKNFRTEVHKSRFNKKAYAVTFTIGVQSFSIETYENKEHAKWTEKQLINALNNLQNNLVVTDKKEKGNLH